MRTKSNAQSPTDNPDGPQVLFLPSPIPKVGQTRAHGRLSMNSSLLLERDLHVDPLLRVIPKDSRRTGGGGEGDCNMAGGGGISGRLPGSYRAT